MHKILTLFVFLLFTSLCFSQTITLKGKITDSGDLPLESATVYITSAKDSTVIDYTISGRNGDWEIKTRAISQPVFLKVSFVGLSDFKEQLQSATEDRDFGTIQLADRPTELDEVVVQGEVPPIRIKSDTLEFNASSFKVRPDANVEALLKQLPGVEIDDEGKITVNGKEVNQILVNGKPFFDKDGKIALQNLPADIINKVQVSDTKTKQEELSGQKASGNNSSINLTIDEDKNKGLFGKFVGGYGSSERYESSAIVNYFKGKRKISFLGSSNNINTTGFSMDEIFDSMGGGRNTSIYMSGDGSFGINGMRFGGNTGITLSNMIGVNYADEWFKGFDTNASYFYTSADTENVNRTREQNFLPATEDTANPGTFINNNFTTVSNSVTENNRYAHNFNTEFEFKIDSTTVLQFSPKFVKANSQFRSDTQRASFDENEELLNESTGTVLNENDNAAFTNNMYLNKAFPGKKGRSFGAYFNNDNRKDDGANYNVSTNIFYEDENGDGIAEVDIDERNQVRFNRQTTDNYDMGLEYIEPLTDSLQFKFGVNYRLNKSVEDRKGFDFDNLTGDYTQLNDELTNYLTSKTSTIIPKAGLNLNKGKINGSIYIGPAITNFDNFSFYLGEATSFNRQYVLPTIDANLSYRMDKSKAIYAYYDYDVNFPQARQVLPVEDISNPFVTYVGNPDLDPNINHQLYFSFRDYDFASRSGYSIYAGGNVNEKDIVINSTFDESARSITTYANVSGTYGMWAGGNWSKQIKNEGGHTYRFNLGLSTGYDYNKGITNNQGFESRSYNVSPRVNFTWEYGELFTINPSYRYNYEETNYTNYTIDAQSNFTHRLNVQITNYWPKNFVVGNDFGYNYNSQIADGFRKDFFLWNTSVGYNFLNNKLLFKVKVYDVLNQNLSTTRSITPTQIRDEENTVLRRYVMFSLTYKLTKFGAKEKKDEGSRFWWW